MGGMEDDAVARRSNSTLMTLVLLAAVVGMGWLAYEFVIVRKIFQTEAKTFVPREQLEEIRTAVLDAYKDDACLVELGPLHYRAREDQYRLDIIVEDGCEEQARKMCVEISDLIYDLSDRTAQVWAMDSGHQVVSKYLP